MSVLVRQLRYEQLIFWRSREAAIFVFLLPVLLFLLLGAVYSGDIQGDRAASYLLAGMVGYGVANTAFGGLAIFLVVRRENGILKRIRSTPLPAATYLASVLVSTLVVFVLQAVALLVVGRLLYGAELPTRPGSLVLALALGAVAFAGLGVGAAALIRSSEGAAPIVNVVVLPMAFLSGSFGPEEEYPRLLEAIGQVLPLKHFLDLVGAIYLDQEAVWSQGRAIAVVALWGLVGVAIAVRRFRWEPVHGVR
jgi:ABC-2 type transport system permease protein